MKFRLTVTDPDQNAATADVDISVRNGLSLPPANGGGGGGGGALGLCLLPFFILGRRGHLR